jgi:hypothetical protein
MKEKDAIKVSQKSWCNMWGVPLRLKDPLRELLSIWYISGESKLSYSVVHKICATVALSEVTTLRAAEVFCLDSRYVPIFCVLILLPRRLWVLQSLVFRSIRRYFPAGSSSRDGNLFLSSHPHAPYDPPISFFSILSPEQYLVSSTDH